MVDNSLHLDNQLCFSIYACSREVTRFLPTVFRRNGHYVSTVHYFTRTMGARWTNSKRNWRTSIFRFRYVNTYAKTNGIIKPCKNAFVPEKMSEKYVLN